LNGAATTTGGDFRIDSISASPFPPVHENEEVEQDASRLGDAAGPEEEREDLPIPRPREVVLAGHLVDAVVRNEREHDFGMAARLGDRPAGAQVVGGELPLAEDPGGPEETRQQGGGGAGEEGRLELQGVGARRHPAT
jgi:hypothetical protein